jgi:hypothetical protein
MIENDQYASLATKAGYARHCEAHVNGYNSPLLKPIQSQLCAIQGVDVVTGQRSLL